MVTRIKKTKLNKKEPPKIEFKKGFDTKSNHYLKMFMYGATNSGTTYGALHILRSKYFSGDVIIMNTDVPQNLEGNLSFFTDVAERLIIPRDSEGNIIRIDSIDILDVITDYIENYIKENKVAGIIVDYVDKIYDLFIQYYNPKTPFEYALPRSKFREWWEKVINFNTNIVIIGKEYPAYSGDDQFSSIIVGYQSIFDGSKSLEKFKVDLNFIAYRELLNRNDRSQRKFRTVLEKHKIGIDPIVIEGNNSNCFDYIYDYYLKKKEELSN